MNLLFGNLSLVRLTQCFCGFSNEICLFILGSSSLYSFLLTKQFGIGKLKTFSQLIIITLEVF